MLPLNRLPHTQTPQTPLIRHNPTIEPSLGPDTVTLYFNLDTAPTVDNIISVLIVDTDEVRELHRALREELNYALSSIKQALSDTANFTNEDNQRIRQSVSNTVIARCKRHEITGVTRESFQRIFITLFPQLVEAVSNFLGQKPGEVSRVLMCINLNEKHYLFIDKRNNDICLFCNVTTHSKTQDISLVLLILDERIANPMRVDPPPCSSHSSLWSGQSALRYYSVPISSGHPMQTRSKSSQQPVVERSIPYPQQRFIQNRSSALHPSQSREPAKNSQFRSNPVTQHHSPHPQATFPANDNCYQLPPAIQQQSPPDHLPFSRIYIEQKNAAVIQELIGNQYNRYWDAANNLMLWMIKNDGNFPPTHKNIELTSLFFKPNDQVAKIPNVHYIFFQFPAIVNLSYCYWEYPDTVMSFRNGTVMTSNAEIWAIGKQAWGNAVDNGNVFLMQDARGFAVDSGKIKRLS